MGKIIDWFKNFVKEPDKSVRLNAVCKDLASDIYLQKIAFYSCVNRIANAFSKCEIKTFIDGEEEKRDEYYLWNYSPNKNQNASVFKTKLITKLYEDNQVLIIESNDGQLFVADSFVKNESALYGNSFSQVQVDDFVFNKTFYHNEVMFIELNNNDIRQLLDGMLNKYIKLLDLAFYSYKTSSGSKGVLYIDSFAMGNDDFEETFKNLVEEDFNTFYESSDGVLPLFDGYKYEGVEKGNKSSNTRDIRELYNDVAEFTARALNIPSSLATGAVQDTSKAIDEFLTFCIDPLMKLIEEEANRKRYGKLVLKNSYLKIDTTSIKHIDIFDISSNIEKLIGSGTHTINDIKKACGEPEINEDWANQHFMTKNFSKIEDLINNLKGGDEDEQVEAESKSG